MPLLLLPLLLLPLLLLPLLLVRAGAVLPAGVTTGQAGRQTLQGGSCTG
jgi:hypothetical protein